MSTAAGVKDASGSALLNFYDGGFFSEGTHEVGDAMYLSYTDSNGDQAKGQFADCSLVFGNNDFEIYSINVDYEPTNLDHNS